MDEDWELLHDFNFHDTELYSSDFPDSNSSFLQVIEADSLSGSTICFDYFSLRNHEPNSNTALESSTTTATNACFADDGLLDDYQLNHLTEITTDVENLERREADDANLVAKNMYSPILESEEAGEEIESQDEVLDDSIGNEPVAMKSGDDGKDLGGADEEVMKVEAKSGEVEAQRRSVPFQVLRYCFLRASPGWSFSVAVAFMGMVILGRRLYNMKRKTKSLLQLKIAVDDKKVSQLARLNEAFSVAVVRGSLTGAGANSWPAMR